MTSPLDVHRGLLAIDTHIDIPWPEGPDPFEETRRRVDLPKMLRGGIAAGCFAAYVPQAPRTAENDQAAYARVTAMLETIEGMRDDEWGRGANWFGAGYKTVLDLCQMLPSHFQEHAAQIAASK